MPSSISSSESRFVQDRVPENAAPAIWCLALLLSAGLLAAGETGWRWAGHRPSVVDSLQLWSYHRSRASQSDPHTLVLCGASRSLLGFSTQAFHQRHPDWKVSHLAVDGREPLATLQDLAKDPQFRGLVLLEVHESAIGYGQGQDEQVEFHHHRMGWANCTNTIECVCCAAIQNQLVAVHPTLNPKRLLSGWWNDRFPSPSYRQGYFDRSVDADYQRLDAKTHREWRLKRVRTSYQRWGAPTPEQWREKAAGLVAAAETIAKHGGQVVFVRYPTSGEYWDLDCKHYPRGKYWDPLIRGHGLSAVHFQDLPQSRSIECPDASHLDYRDKDTFTNELLDILERTTALSPRV